MSASPLWTPTTTDHGGPKWRNGERPPEVDWAELGPEFFDTAKYPKATYKGKLEGFKAGGNPKVTGELTLHGVTKPVALKVNGFKCMDHPMLKRDYCGADALATFERDQFGLNAGKDYHFNMEVTLRIQVEAIKAEAAGKKAT